VVKHLRRKHDVVGTWRELCGVEVFPAVVDSLAESRAFGLKPRNVEGLLGDVNRIELRQSSRLIASRSTAPTPIRD
jgi:hypothetical protein